MTTDLSQPGTFLSIGNVKTNVYFNAIQLVGQFNDGNLKKTEFKQEITQAQEAS